MEFVTQVHVGDEDEVGFMGGSNISSLEDLGNNSIAQDKRQKRDIGI